jgi:hypothetical protein
MLTQVRPFSVASLTLENPKVVGRFLLGTITLALVIALFLGTCLGDFSPLLWILGGLAAMLVVCVLLSLVFTVLFAPLPWLLSRLSGRNHDRGPPAEEKRR